MKIDSAVDFVEVIRQIQLLEPEQLEELARLRAGIADPRLLARRLIEKSWLTPYQINQLFQQRGQDLVLGQYVLLERIGEGGMGQVFKARHRRLDRIVALKVIRREHVTNQDAVRRFRREIQATASLSHPNIVLAYDADQVGDTHFLVMEFVDGTDLGSLLKKTGPPAVEQACDYMRQAAAGFQHAHEHGLVHRDIKPSNLLVTRASDSGYGTILKILDLGVARLLQPPDGLDSVSALTKDGRVVGTPDYMAPEQAANSSKADIRSDLYSLGCTFFHLIAGQVPFPGGTPMEKLLKHRIEAPRPLEKVRPQVPPAVAAVVRRLMAKKPEERYQTPAELGLALDALKGGSAPQAILVPSGGAFRSGPPAAVPSNGPAPTVPMASWATPDMGVTGASGRSKKRWLLLAGGAVALIVALVFFLVLLFSPGPKNQTQGPTKPENQVSGPLRELAARVQDPRANRDDLRRDLLQFRQEHAGTPLGLEAVKLLMKLPSPLDELTHDRLLGQERDLFPPQVVALLGESRQRHWGQARCVAVRPDGRLLASGGNDEVIRLWDPTTMRQRAVLLGHTAPVFWLGFTPDGQMLLSASGNGSMRVWEDLTGNPHEVLALRTSINNLTDAPALSPDGQTLAVGGVASLPTLPVEVRLLDLKGLKKKVPPSWRTPLTGHLGGVRAVAFSGDGSLLASAGQDGKVLVWDMSGAAPKVKHTLTKPAGVSHPLAFSGDGKTVALAHQGEIHRWDLSKEEPEELPALRTQTGVIHALAFAPGRLISSSNDNVVRLWDASSEPKELTRLKGIRAGGVYGLAVSANGATLFTAGQDTTVRQWSLAGEPRQVPNALGVDAVATTMAAALTPAGKTVAIIHEQDAILQLWDPASSRKNQARLSAGWGQAVVFSPDGQMLAVAVAGGAGVELRRLTDGKLEAPEALVPGLGRVVALAFSGDGKTLAAGCADGTIRVCSPGGAPPRRWRPLTTLRMEPVALAISPDGKTVAVATPAWSNETKTVRLLRADTGAEIGSIAELRVAALAFAPDGQSLATAGVGSDRAPDLRMWDLRAGQPKAISVTWAKGHVGPLTSVAFTPDGEWLVTAGQDGMIVLHGPATGQTIDSWKLPGPVRGVSLAADGRHLVTANGNGTVSLLRYRPVGR
jgi:serine/threonine protein kinase/WD40 repeat protein